MATKSSRGGRRPGAGRPKHSGRYGEPTTALRVPKSLLPAIDSLLRQAAQRTPAPSRASDLDRLWLPDEEANPLALALYTSRVAAGKPSAADDHSDEVLDLNQLLIRQPANSYYVRVSGDSMIDAGIHPGDVLVVERAATARHGQIVIAEIEGEITVKRYYINEGKIRLVAENPRFPPIKITRTMDFRLCGIVTGLVRQFL